MFLSCILKKPDVDDEYTGEEENHLKHDEEFLSRSERDIQGTLHYIGHAAFFCCTGYII